MKRSQANRAVIAARAKAPTSNDVPMLRTSIHTTGTGPVRRSRAVRLTATQRNSQGARSEWSMSQNYWTVSAWDKTVSTA